MGRIIRSQLIAGSGSDIHGDGIDRDTIRELFRQIQTHSVGGVEHDLSRHPVVRLFNYRLEERPDGELVIKADIEVFDEDTFSRMGGFSISFRRLTHRIGPSDPVLKILLNPKQFDFERASTDIVRQIPKGFTLDVTERIEKAAVAEIAIIVLVISGLSEVAKGFFSAAGADLYRWLRNLRRTDDPEGKTDIHIDSSQPISGSPVRFLLVVDPDVTGEEFAQFDPQSVRDKLPPGIAPRSITRVVARLNPGPSVVLEFTVLEDGSRVQINRE